MTCRMLNILQQADVLCEVGCDTGDVWSTPKGRAGGEQLCPLCIVHTAGHCCRLQQCIWRLAIGAEPFYWSVPLGIDQREQRKSA